MPFREKSAWITLISVVLTFGHYYGALALGVFSPMSMAAFHLGLAVIIGFVLLQIALRLIAVATSPKGDRLPRDERERMIEARSHTIGYYVQMFGILAVVFATHVPGQGFLTTVYLGVGTVLVAAMAVAIAQIIMFRRGA
jgi:hypothetical protein